MIALLFACLNLVASATPPPAGAGTSFADAIVVTASTEGAGVDAEYAYVARHPCAGGSWKVTKQSLLTHGGKPYDVLDAACSNGGGTRAFFFDISSFFGKM
jgi:hypothetical protein